jgi:hypothetical protein
LPRFCSRWMRDLPHPFLLFLVVEDALVKPSGLSFFIGPRQQQVLHRALHPLGQSVSALLLGLLLRGKMACHIFLPGLMARRMRDLCSPTLCTSPPENSFVLPWLRGHLPPLLLHGLPWHLLDGVPFTAWWRLTPGPLGPSVPGPLGSPFGSWAGPGGSFTHAQSASSQPASSPNTGP